jgi:hypothetical protein
LLNRLQTGTFGSTNSNGEVQVFNWIHGRVQAWAFDIQTQWAQYGTCDSVVSPFDHGSSEPDWLPVRKWITDPISGKTWLLIDYSFFSFQLLITTEGLCGFWDFKKTSNTKCALVGL